MGTLLELNQVCYDLKEDGTAAVVKYVDGAPDILAFPGTVRANGRDFVVKSISCFQGWSGTKIIIPKSVEFLGEKCFCRCLSLSEVVFESGSNLTRIDKEAFCSDGNVFNYSGLKSMRIPPKVECIGEYCFSYCKSLSEVIFEAPSSLKEIGRGAFLDSGVTSIEIPEKCNVLEGALAGLKSVSVSSQNPFFCCRRRFDNER
jgi:hypothetical protein